MSDYIELGKISGFFGIKGWVKLYSYTRPRISIDQYKQFYLGESKAEVAFTTIKESGKYIVGHIKDVDTREDTMRYQEQVIYIKNDDLPELNNEYYWHELIGLLVVNQDNKTLGKIMEMMETGANDVMVIQNEKHEETLIPYVMSLFVLSIDLDAGTVQVNWEVDV